MDLIASTALSPDVANALINSDYSPIARLFSLLSCGISPILKGGVLHALAALASSPNGADEIWQRMEQYRLVPSKILSSADSRPTGLKLELEAVESKTGQYPVTDGLLSLLISLTEQHPIPVALGSGYRFPGILPYLDHVLNSVLLKAFSRLYLPEGSEGESQRFRLIAKSLRILVIILQKYPVNLLLKNVPAEALPGVKSSEVIFDPFLR